MSPLLGWMFASASAGCNDDAETLICTVEGQQFVYQLPQWAATVALAVTLLLRISLRRLDDCWWLGYPIGYILSVAGFLASYSIASQA
ncbi:hypothetical protein [Plantactinospora sp. CA-290183]|uniref:hypothetical protein n=1 Tax=Plantactinospora sp. CA-290183 TaxID=3240006 RepID=UPI003D9328DA